LILKATTYEMAQRRADMAADQNQQENIDAEENGKGCVETLAFHDGCYYGCDVAVPLIVCLSVSKSITITSPPIL
jgi:hypothetical protein